MLNDMHPMLAYCVLHGLAWYRYMDESPHGSVLAAPDVIARGGPVLYWLRKSETRKLEWIMLRMPAPTTRPHFMAMAEVPLERMPPAALKALTYDKIQDLTTCE